jgi:hypothetical protein
MEYVCAKKLWMDWWKTINLNGLFLPYVGPSQSEMG